MTKREQERLRFWLGEMRRPKLARWLRWRLLLVREARMRWHVFQLGGQHPELNIEDWIARARARALCERFPPRTARFILPFLLVLLVAGVHATAQGIDVIHVQNNGTAAGTLAGPFTLNCLLASATPCAVTSGPKTLAITVGGGGSSVVFQTNGTNNSSQAALNLVAGSGVTLTNTSGGNVTVAAAGGGGSGVIFAQTSVQAGDTQTSGAFATIYTFPAGTFCPSAGTVYHIHDAGTSSTSTTVFDLGIGASRVMQLAMPNPGTGTSVSWFVEGTITCLTTGASGTYEFQGYAGASTSSAGGGTAAISPQNAAPYTINTTASVQITPLAQLTSGTMTQRQLIITKE